MTDQHRAAGPPSDPAMGVHDALQALPPSASRNRAAEALKLAHLQRVKIELHVIVTQTLDFDCGLLNDCMAAA